MPENLKYHFLLPKFLTAKLQKFHCFLFCDRFFKESLKYLLDDGSSTSINTLSLFANISKKLKVRQYTGFLYINKHLESSLSISQQVFTSSKLTIETLEQSVKYVQS